MLDRRKDVRVDLRQTRLGRTAHPPKSFLSPRNNRARQAGLAIIGNLKRRGLTRHFVDGRPFGAATVRVLTLATRSEASLPVWALVAETLSVMKAYCLIFVDFFRLGLSAPSRNPAEPPCLRDHVTAYLPPAARRTSGTPQPARGRLPRPLSPSTRAGARPWQRPGEWRLPALCGDQQGKQSSRRPRGYAGYLGDENRITPAKKRPYGGDARRHFVF
jgi:hypothetical protein